jgi:hypothetical protein
MTLAAGLPDALAISFFLMPLPYILTAVVGVVRSAGKYRGPPQWATHGQKSRYFVGKHVWFAVGDYLGGD